MAYKSGKQVLPEHLLVAIQEYIDGEYIYIPRKLSEEKVIKSQTFERNVEIFNKYSSGMSVDALSQVYYLSPKTIYGIIGKIRKG